MKSSSTALLLIGVTFSEPALAGSLINIQSPGTIGGTPYAGAVPDAVWGLTNCVVNAGSLVVNCPGAAAYTPSTSPTAPSLLIADDVGTITGTVRVPYVGTITAATIVGTTLNLTLSAAPPLGNARGIANHVANFDVVNSGQGYSFQSTQTIDCPVGSLTCTNSVPAVGKPSVMSMIAGSNAIVTRGSGGTPAGTCSSLIPASQIGLSGAVTTFSGTIATGTGSLMGSLAIVQLGKVSSDIGSYSTSTGKYTDTLIGCGFTTANGPTVAFAYQINQEQLVAGTGIYSGTPPCNNGLTGDTTTSALPATGLTLSCAASSETYPGTVSFGTDNTIALQKLVAVSNTAAAIGTPDCLYVPSGNYLVEPLNAYTTTSNQASGQYLSRGYGCWLGDEHYLSNLFVVPNIQGDVVAWVDSNQNSSLVTLGSTVTFSNFHAATPTANQAGSSFRNISIFGNRLSTALQNGLSFYGKTTFSYVDDIVVDYMTGRAFYAGGQDAPPTSQGDFNESVVQNVRFENDGYVNFHGDGVTYPAFEITATGPAEGSNSISLSSIRIFQPFGPGLWIHNQGIGLPARDLKLINVLIEGSNVSRTTLGGDLLEIGDPAAQPGSNVSSFLGRNVQLVNPVQGFAALRITGNTSADAANIDIEGGIQGAPTDPGRGLQVEVCTECSFKFDGNSAADYDLVVGRTNASTQPVSACANSLLQTPGIIYDGDGGEPALTSCIDPAAALLVQYPSRHN